MKIERLEDIEAWRMGRDLTRQVYQRSAQGVLAKDRSLTDQMIRAASSIMHNIAEGFDVGSNAEFIRLPGYSCRSCTEVQSQTYIASDQSYLTQDEFHALYDLAGQTRGKVGVFDKCQRRSKR